MPGFTATLVASEKMIVTVSRGSYYTKDAVVTLSNLAGSDYNVTVEIGASGDFGYWQEWIGNQHEDFARITESNRTAYYKELPSLIFSVGNYGEGEAIVIFHGPFGLEYARDTLAEIEDGIYKAFGHAE